MPDQSPGFNLYARARDCLCAGEVETKLSLVDALYADWQEGRLQRTPIVLEEVVEAGHPPRPELVHPRKLPRRSLTTPEGRRALIHAVAHIEFNAINLACDAIYRFRDLPDVYYGDWIGVAAEEARHFRLLQARLEDEGCRYGDFAAHNGLWDMALRTAEDPLKRMALVPRMLEARGLDVTPGMIQRLRAEGDDATVAVLQVILEEEIGHVALGSRWFTFICESRNLVPESTYFELLGNFGEGSIRPPLNHEARRRAGFSEEELARLDGICGSR
ncbi:MAG: ferritin-like domain-containing protein [Gammaproteobacteria bacterium]|nr:ferritin-like domain-containing protein [Gammaproteobacteria bacterium]